MATSTSTAAASHSEIPPWKIELIQRKKKFGIMSPTQRNIMQCDLNGDAHSGMYGVFVALNEKEIHFDANLTNYSLWKM